VESRGRGKSAAATVWSGQRGPNAVGYELPKFCMLLDWGIMNNFLNCADIQISIDVELKFLEQIHNLNFW
jgi:hypothetical protein